MGISFSEDNLNYAMNLTVQVITVSPQLTNVNEERGVNLIGSFDDEVEALKFTAINKPSIILLDYELEKENTVLFINSLHLETPNSKVMLFGNNLSDEIILSCMSSFISGYMEWRDVTKFLNKAIRSIEKGEAWVSRRLVGLLIYKLQG